MKLIEMKQRVALQAAELIFQNIKDVVFIGGTALNAFYLDYRFSEDLDIGYLKKNVKSAVEELLKKNGYGVEKTNFDFRDIITFEGVSIKLDVIDHVKKYNGFTKKMLGRVEVTTLAIEEFAVEKTISFFTRENIDGLARDAYDLFSLEKEYGVVLNTAKDARQIIRKNVTTLDHNIELFEGKPDRVEEALYPYLRKEVNVKSVAQFLKKLRGVLHE